MATTINQLKTIEFGDRIFARVIKNGETILNIVSENIGNMTDLIAEIKKGIKNINGLVMIHIRNFHRGWDEERPLMLNYQSSGRSLNLQGLRRSLL